MKSITLDTAELLKPACARIKDQTSAAHRALHECPLLGELVSPRLSLAKYVKILSSFYSFYHDYESILLQACADFPYDAYARQKLPLLEQDAKALGVSLERSEGVFPLINLDDQAKVLGMIYVVEGSSLGGQVISKHLAQNLGLNAMHGAAYFHGYGSATGPRWRETQAFLDDFEVQGGSIATMITTARLVFVDLQSRLHYHMAAKLADSSAEEPGINAFYSEKTSS